MASLFGNDDYFLAWNEEPHVRIRLRNDRLSIWVDFRRVLMNQPLERGLRGSNGLVSVAVDENLSVALPRGENELPTPPFLKIYFDWGKLGLADTPGSLGGALILRDQRHYRVEWANRLPLLIPARVDFARIWRRELVRHAETCDFYDRLSNRNYWFVDCDHELRDEGKAVGELSIVDNRLSFRIRDDSLVSGLALDRGLKHFLDWGYVTVRRMNEFLFGDPQRRGIAVLNDHLLVIGLDEKFRRGHSLSQMLSLIILETNGRLSNLSDFQSDENDGPGDRGGFGEAPWPIGPTGSAEGIHQEGLNQMTSWIETESRANPGRLGLRPPGDMDILKREVPHPRQLVLN